MVASTMNSFDKRATKMFRDCDEYVERGVDFISDDNEELREGPTRIRTMFAAGRAIQTEQLRSDNRGK